MPLVLLCNILTSYCWLSGAALNHFRDTHEYMRTCSLYNVRNNRVLRVKSRPVANHAHEIVVLFLLAAYLYDVVTTWNYEETFDGGALRLAIVTAI